MTKLILPEPQHNRTGTGNFVNLIMTSTVECLKYQNIHCLKARTINVCVCVL